MRDILDRPAHELSGLADLSFDRGADGAPDIRRAVALDLREGQEGPASAAALLSDQDAFHFGRCEAASDEAPVAGSANVIPFRPRTSPATRGVSR